MRDPAQVAHICVTLCKSTVLPFERGNCICDANFSKNLKKVEKNFKYLSSCSIEKNFYNERQITIIISPYKLDER